MFNNIKICYGPYEVYGVIKHRTRRLQKLIDKLIKHKFIVEIYKTDARDRLVVHLLNVPVFQCQYSLLRYADSSKEDKTLEQCLKAVNEARSKIKYYLECNEQIKNIKNLTKDMFNNIVLQII